MPFYHVNRNSQSNGDHEVHTNECVHGADQANQLDLGWHQDCHAAVQKAKQTYPSANGCYHCSYACHTS